MSSSDSRVLPTGVTHPTVRVFYASSLCLRALFYILMNVPHQRHVHIHTAQTSVLGVLQLTDIYFLIETEPGAGILPDADTSPLPLEAATVIR